jgi:hypothetical protein
MCRGDHDRASGVAPFPVSRCRSSSSGKYAASSRWEGRHGAQGAERPELHGFAEVGEQGQPLVGDPPFAGSSIWSKSSVPRTDPIRQGKHFPQLSTAQKAMSPRQISTRSWSSVYTTIPACPGSLPPGRGPRSPGGCPGAPPRGSPQGAADLHPLERLPVGHPSGPLEKDLAEGDAELHLVEAGAGHRRVQAHELRAPRASWPRAA